MRENYVQDRGNSFSSFCAGALLGVGLALLLAPERGSEVRSFLRRYAARLTDTLTDHVSDDASPAAEETASEKPLPVSTERKSGEGQFGQRQERPEQSTVSPSKVSSGKSASGVVDRAKPEEMSSTGVPNPTMHPREYKEAMKKYETPDGNP